MTLYIHLYIIGFVLNKKNVSFMSKEEIKKLKAAYDAVFNEKGEIKACGRDACTKLISLMKKYTSKNIGDIRTGKLEIDVIKMEYYRVITIWYFFTFKSCSYVNTIF